jgi:glycosyltransferase involved in cell wall biosynthesis
VNSQSAFAFRSKQASQRKRFLHVSTLDKNTKNPRGIVDACKLLKDQDQSFEVTIVSDEDHSDLSSYANQLGLQDTVSFVGPQSWEEMPKYYYQADAFLLNSDYETFSIVLAEALSTGTPIISTQVGIANELPKDIVISIEKNNPTSLMEAMLQVISEERTFDHSQIAELAKSYHSKQILKQWTHLIESHVR